MFSCYTFELLYGSSSSRGSSRFALIVYTDGGSARERGKLHNISLHVLYTGLVNFYVNYSLCTLRCFVHNYEGRMSNFSVVRPTGYRAVCIENFSRVMSGHTCKHKMKLLCKAQAC